jgi:diadenosine tetraphosphate (Ap4A) HIT family hydrolase
MLGVINVTDNHESCVFCDYIKNRNFVMDNDYAIAVYDNFPVNKGHMLIIPKRHFASFFDASADEISAIDDLIKKAKSLLDNKLNPDGYNIGINIGEAAGQTIFHLHIHLIPRYFGDAENPRGGIRKFKPALVEYDG